MIKIGHPLLLIFLGLVVIAILTLGILPWIVIYGLLLLSIGLTVWILWTAILGAGFQPTSKMVVRKMLDMAEIDPAKLCLLYPEMRQHLGNCRFSECLHMTEPDCGVKPFVGNGISPERYERYCKFAEELKEKRKHRYD